MSLFRNEQIATLEVIQRTTEISAHF